MKTLSILLFTLLINTTPWLGNFTDAQKEASVKHKLIIINFSGSDWCGPCIRLRKEILETAVFDTYAADNLVLVRADFPRQKKNQLSKEQTKLNEALADKYNPEGKFPYTLLVDQDGKVLKAWDGFPNKTPEQFVADVSAFKR
jgi:thioredoxin-related protein